MVTDPLRVLIREATEDDANSAEEVAESAFAPLRSVYRPTGDAIARQIERAQEGTRLVAEFGGRIIATVQFAVHEKHVHVIGPEFQRRGIGRQLIERIVRLAPSLERRVVALDTIRETGNVSLFEKLGFRVIRETVPTWCTSEKHAELHDVMMERCVDEAGS